MTFCVCLCVDTTLCVREREREREKKEEGGIKGAHVCVFVCGWVKGLPQRGHDDACLWYIPRGNGEEEEEEEGKFPPSYTTDRSHLSENKDGAGRRRK